MNRKEILEKPLWTATEVAVILCRSKRFVAGEVALKRLKGKRIGERTMYARCHLVDYLGGEELAASILRI